MIERRPAGHGHRAARALVAAAVVVLVAGIVMAATATYALAHGVAARKDTTVLRWFTAHRSPGLLHLAHDVTDLGLLGVLAAIAVVAAAIFRLRGLKLSASLAPLLSLGAAALTTAVVKGVVGRPGPQHVFGTATAPGTAFPSGHAADSTAVFVSVALVLAVSVLRRPAARAAVIVVGIAMAVAVGLSRLVLDVHWPTDVVAGWALGTMAALVVTTPVLLRSTPADPGPDRLLHHTP